MSAIPPPARGQPCTPRAIGPARQDPEGREGGKDWCMTGRETPGARQASDTGPIAPSGAQRGCAPRLRLAWAVTSVNRSDHEVQFRSTRCGGQAPQRGDDSARMASPDPRRSCVQRVAGLDRAVEPIHHAGPHPVDESRPDRPVTVRLRPARRGNKGIGGARGDPKAPASPGQRNMPPRGGVAQFQAPAPFLCECAGRLARSRRFQGARRRVGCRSDQGALP